MNEINSNSPTSDTTTVTSACDAVSAARRSKAAEQLVAELDSRFFKALSEPVRVEILKFLMLRGCCDIGTIAEHMPQDRSVISRHLSTMLDAGLVTCVKESRFSYYDVNSQFFLMKAEAIVEQIRNCIMACCPSEKCPAASSSTESRPAEK